MKCVLLSLENTKRWCLLLPTSMLLSSKEESTELLAGINVMSG